jgi:bifunctional non-homologous end joining protein LigD
LWENCRRNRGLWVNVKCLNREEFVMVGWIGPAGSRSCLGSLLLAYCDSEGRLAYARRAGIGIAWTDQNR